MVSGTFDILNPTVANSQFIGLMQLVVGKLIPNLHNYTDDFLDEDSLIEVLDQQVYSYILGALRMIHVGG